jgi:AraC-like DNA-binding protein
MDVLSTSRLDQESQLISRWISRLYLAVSDANKREFSSIVETVGIKRVNDGSYLATKEQFDTVMRRLRRIQADIYFKFYETMDLLELGLMGYAAISSGSVKNAINVLLNYQDLTTSSFYFQSEEINGQLTITVVPFGPYLQHNNLIVEDALAGIWHFVSVLVSDVAAKEACTVNFNYPAPQSADIYKEYFPANIHFNADKASLVLPKAILQTPMTTANSEMADLCLSICDRIFGRLTARSDLRHTVQRLIMTRPGDRMLGLEEAAAAVNMSSSQFRKKLYQLGTSYREIVVQTRMSLAQHYLKSTALNVQEISYMLDYKNPSAFSRAYKSYFNENPIDTKQRQNLAGVESASIGFNY